MARFEQIWRSTFLRFALIGAAGFVVDTATLYAARGLGADLYSGRVVSYLVAATFTWFGNRTITFAASRARGAGGMVREWLTFLLVNLGGGLTNYAVYALLVTLSSTVAAYPVLGVAAGSIAGLAVNFAASKRFVFGANRASGDSGAGPGSSPPS